MKEKVHANVKEVYPDQQLMVCYIGDREVFVKGTVQDLYPQDELILFGEYKRNHLYGQFFELTHFREKLSDFWMAKWLKKTTTFSDGEIASMLVQKNGLQHVSVQWERIELFHRILSFLEEKGLPEEEVAKIESDYRYQWDKILDDPYRFLHYTSISFEWVQQLVSSFDFAQTFSSKTKHFLEKELNQALTNGHFYLPSDVIKRTFEQKRLKFKEDILDERFHLFERGIYLKDSFDIEQTIALDIQTRLNVETPFSDESPIEMWETQKGFQLAPNQKKAVAMALNHHFCVVTGGPGVGKTTVCNCITDLLGENQTILMVAPTGRAAKRAKESTGLDTSTIHRLLEYNGTAFLRNRFNQIEADVLVIDESSMVDAPLLHSLLEALPIETKIIFVGDVDQLPSVGPGQVLKDLIDSQVVPVTKLTDIFRQAKGSPIIDCAYRVNDGMMPEIVQHEDLQYLEKKTETKILQATIDIAEELYTQHSLFDVQILIPMYNGPVGINAVNDMLQDYLNPDAPRVKVHDYEIRQGDKVIQTKNDYQKGIFNGDVGIVKHVSPHEISVLFQGETHEITYGPDKFGDLKLSYAVTIHRSQGSEYPYVVIPIVESYKSMLQKNLVYTAITRSKKKLWLIYQSTAFEKAVDVKSVPRRYTSLARLLQPSG